MTKELSQLGKHEFIDTTAKWGRDFIEVLNPLKENAILRFYHEPPQKPLPKKEWAGMTEEEKMVFWGDLVEPMTALIGGLLVRGEYKLVDVVRYIVAKAENAALEEREACAKRLDAVGCDHCAENIRLRGRE